MAFRLQATGVFEIAHHQFLTEVMIERRLYDHSRATATLRWHEDSRYGERQTANIAASALNCPVSIQWIDNDLSESVDCFQGYVENVSSLRRATISSLVLECVTYSKRTDLVPRYRAFQACRLLDICQHIAKTEPLIKIANPGDLDFDIALSLQYGETDYAYLRRMLHAWGIPMAVAHNTGELLLGARGSQSKGRFPDADFGWASVAFSGCVDFFPKRENHGSGPANLACRQVDQLNGQLKTKANHYYPVPDSQLIRDRVSAVQSQVDTARYNLKWEGAVLPYSPGEVVRFENQDLIIRRVNIIGDRQETTAIQEFELQPFPLPYQPNRLVPQWTSRTLWAHVVDNEKDPLQQGRIQVKFELESLDPQSSSEKVWLHTLTPYGGGKSVSDGKAGEYNGFYSLPEVGERVLVQFLGDWDSEAVVIGTVREASVNPMYNARHTKRWRTPSGNEVTLTTKGSTDVIRIKCQDKVFLESRVEGDRAEVHITPGESDADCIHFQKGAGPSRLDIVCGGQINIHAEQKLHLEGQQVQIKASGGDVNIDGAPNVMINCAPIPMTPFQLTHFEEEKTSTRAKPRKLPAPTSGRAVSGTSETASTRMSGTSAAPGKKRTWVDIMLRDEHGVPIPNARYRLKLPDGTVIEGQLDAEGRARVHGVEPGSAQVSFPDHKANDWQNV
jgi:hypothetical protein